MIQITPGGRVSRYLAIDLTQIGRKAIRVTEAQRGIAGREPGLPGGDGKNIIIKLTHKVRI